jgi:hypothetical protein
LRQRDRRADGCAFGVIHGPTAVVLTQIARAIVSIAASMFLSTELYQRLPAPFSFTHCAQGQASNKPI